MNAARAVVLTTLVAVSAASCGAPLLKLPTGPGLPAPDAAAALMQAVSACRRITTVSAEVAVSGSVGGRRVRGRILAGLAEPASLYIEAPAPFGAPLFVFGASNGDATLLLPRDRRVLEHGRPVEVLEAIAGVPLDPADLRRTLTGCLADTGVDAGSARGFGDLWRIVPGERDAYLKRDRPADPWRLVAVLQPGQYGWRADYSAFMNDVPRSIRLVSNDAGRFDLRLDLSQVDLNVALEPAVFQIAIPPGAQPMSIEELRANGPLSR
jgi:hypothetical protein